MNGWKKVAGLSILTLAIGLPSVASADMSANMGMMTKDMSMKDIYKGASTMMMIKMNYVSLRQVAMNLGYTVMWDSMDKSITLTCTVMKKDMMDNQNMSNDNKMTDSMSDTNMMNNMMDKKYTVKMPGSNKITVNGKEMMLNVAPVAKMGTTYVSKGFVETYLVNMIGM